jgi:hypothetical protein
MPKVKISPGIRSFVKAFSAKMDGNAINNRPAVKTKAVCKDTFNFLRNRSFVKTFFLNAGSRKATDNRIERILITDEIVETRIITKKTITAKTRMIELSLNIKVTTLFSSV